jgi:hypothetical protein
VASGRVPQVGKEPPVESLFDATTTARNVALWVITPTISVLGASPLCSLLA